MTKIINGTYYTALSGNTINNLQSKRFSTIFFNSIWMVGCLPIDQCSESIVIHLDSDFNNE